MLVDVSLGSRQLVPAIAAQGSQGVAGEAFRVHPHPGWATVVGVDPLVRHEQDVFGPGEVVPVTGHRELAVPGRQFRAGKGRHARCRSGVSRIMGKPPLRQLIVGTQTHTVIPHEFTNETDGFQAGQPGEVDGGLGVTAPLQHSPGAGP